MKSSNTRKFWHCHNFDVIGVDKLRCRWEITKKKTYMYLVCIVWSICDQTTYRDIVNKLKRIRFQLTDYKLIDWHTDRCSRPAKIIIRNKIHLNRHVSSCSCVLGLAAMIQATNIQAARILKNKTWKAHNKA